MQHIPASLTSVAAGSVAAGSLAAAVPPTVTVVVPCYNYGHFLPQCVASILDQPHVSVDVIVVDDASTDDSATVAQALTDADPRVRLIRHARNKGHIATYNDGLAEVTGTYCMLLSADDLLVPGALGRATALMEAHPNVGLVYGHRIPIVGEAMPVANETVQGWSIWTGEEWVRRICTMGTNVLASPEVLLRSTVQAKIGGYDPKLPHSGDLEMWLRAAAVADVARVDGADHAFYREHLTSMSRSTFYTVPLTDLVERKAAFISAFDGVAGQLPDAAGLRRRALRALASEALDLATGLQQDQAPAEVVQAARDFAIQAAPGAGRTLRSRALALRGRTSAHPLRHRLEPIDRLLVRVRRKVVWLRRQRDLRAISSLPVAATRR